MGNKFLTFLSNFFTPFEYSPTWKHVVSFPQGSCFKSLILKEERFGFEPEVTAKIEPISESAHL
jgi:hypothetical protein